MFGLFNNNKVYATIPAIEKEMKKKFKSSGLDFYRNFEGDYVVKTDRAEVGTISFKVYPRSFDMSVTDAFGVKLLPTQTYIGKHWKDYLDSRLDDALFHLKGVWVPDGHSLNPLFNRMLREIEDPCAELRRLPVTQPYEVRRLPAEPKYWLAK